MSYSPVVAVGYLIPAPSGQTSPGLRILLADLFRLFSFARSCCYFRMPYLVAAFLIVILDSLPVWVTNVIKI